MKTESTVKGTDTPSLRAQSKLMVARRIMGRSVGQITREFNMHIDIVNSRMEWASRPHLTWTADAEQLASEKAREQLTDKRMKGEI